MKRLTRIATALAVAVLPALACAQPTGLFRAYLASTGNDANPCTRAAPCRLLPAAIAAVQDSGEIWILDSANYNIGTVVFDRNVNVVAVPGVLGSIVARAANADTLVVPDGVTVGLRNLDFTAFAGDTFLTGQGIGVSTTGTGKVYVEDCRFTGLRAAGIFVQGPGSATVMRSTFRGNGSGITASGRPSVVVVDSTFLDNSTAVFSTVTAPGANTLSVTRSVIRGSTAGILLSVPTPLAATRSVLRVTDSRIEGLDSLSGQGIGMVVHGSVVADGDFHGNVVQNFGTGMFITGALNVSILGGNTITRTNTGVNSAATVISAGNNIVQGISADFLPLPTSTIIPR